MIHLEDMERKLDLEFGSLRALAARTRSEMFEGMTAWADALGERILPLVRPEHRAEVRRLLRVPDGRAVPDR
jgi:cobalamin biosynthesis Mg chelatase CobN